MSEKVLFYYNPMSRGRIVHWMLEEVGAPYEIKLLSYEKKDHKSPEYLKLNPMGKIPTIVHRSVVVTETAAICAYLADAFPQAGLAPAVDDPKRGTYYRWFFFAAGCIEQATLDKAFPRENSPEASHLGYGSYEATANALATAVADGYILGDRFSAADVYIASQIFWAMMNGHFQEQPVFQKYVQLCTERPAFLRFMEQVNGMAGSA